MEDLEIRSTDLRIDVSAALGAPDPVHIVVTVVHPLGPLSSRPIVAFGFPGGSYSRGYYGIVIDGDHSYDQSAHHAHRGWVFVACDHLGVGESSAPGPGATLETVTAAHHATVGEVCQRLGDGTLAEGLAPTTAAAVIGIGQSMGGFILTMTQAAYRTFDAVALLGHSAIQVALSSPDPTVPPITSTPEELLASDNLAAMFRFWFHWDDVPEALVVRDLTGFPTRPEPVPPWASRTSAPGTAAVMNKGVCAAEAASIDTPVFIGVGERDNVADPRAEPAAYRSSRDITMFVLPRSAHMHNFASTRDQLWDRLHAWGEGIAATTATSTP